MVAKHTFIARASLLGVQISALAAIRTIDYRCFCVCLDGEHKMIILYDFLGG